MQDAIRDHAALLINSVLAVLALFAGFLWLVRRQDMMFAWLGLYAGLWFIANLQFIVPQDNLFHTMGVAALYLLPAALAGFATTETPADIRTRILTGSLVAFVPLLGVKIISGRMGIPAPALAAAFVAFSIVLIVAVARVRAGSTRLQSLALLGAATIGLAGFGFDAAAQAKLVNGPGFPVMPLAGLLSVVIVSFFLGQRVLQALSFEEDMNVMLENRARAAKASLAASEAARRALEVSGAITKERDRLMREIHDGIGSSFITAIAASERRGGAVDPVAVLKGALTDLRIAVDSLEPVQGDVATLLASLRYRVEPDFKKAGIAFDWRVNEVPELSWLDPVNSLQVLRIFQEAFGNIAAHSGATSIIVRCLPKARDGREGIMIEVKDNGTGYEDTGGRKGHGLKNMNRRAETLGGELTMISKLGEGTSVALWIPLDR